MNEKLIISITLSLALIFTVSEISYVGVLVDSYDEHPDIYADSKDRYPNYYKSLEAMLAGILILLIGLVLVILG